MEISYLQAIKEDRREIIACGNCIYFCDDACVRFPPKPWKGIKNGRLCEENIYVYPIIDEFCGEGLFKV